VETLKAAIVKQEVFDLFFGELFRETANENFQGAFLYFGGNDTQSCGV